MGYLQIPIINPLRFRKNALSSDFIRIDSMTQGIQYQRGIYPIAVRPDWKLNEKISILIYYVNYPADLSTFSGTIYNSTGNFPMTRLDVTPSGYDPTTKVFLFEYTPSLELGHYIRIGGSGLDTWTSDIFNVRSNEGQDMIEVVYYDTQNRLSGYWFDGTSQVWTSKAFYTGNIKPQIPENEVSTYEDDGGKVINTRSVPKRIALLTATDIPQVYMDVLNIQLQCDNVTVNEVKYTPLEASDEPVEKADTTTISYKLTQAEDENYLFNQ